MRFQQFTVYPLMTILLISLVAQPSTRPVSAQDEPPPQFLYRDENRLVLVNGYTGETAELPIEVADQDHFDWSPDGQYLLARLQEETTDSYCLNLYDVDAQEWVYGEPISCGVPEAIFSPESTHIVYETNDGTNLMVRLYSIENETSQELYRTIQEIEQMSKGIEQFTWSPTGAYLTFIDYTWIMGGTLNALVVLNVENGNYAVVSAPNPYYASYDPIWSADDRWFLILLKEEYVTNGVVTMTNHQGDVYLVNSDTGEQYRLTYTPAAPEVDIRWTEAGTIAFTMVVQLEMALTIEEALEVEPVPPEEIIEPEVIDTENLFLSMRGVIISPDPNIGAWGSTIETQPGSGEYEFNIGYVSPDARTANFTTLIPGYYLYPNSRIIIGWRPSDYPYPIG
ncbi:MAG: hypothetical protein K8J31_32095 [Anaerolineae bacterium]|nr:hypothetical protein [Anaerolineae bacterium]